MAKPRNEFVFYEHIPTGKQDNVNMWEWEQIQRDPQLRQNYRLLRIVDVTKNQITKAPTNKLDIEDDPLECPLCGYIASSEKVLKTHKVKKHDAEE